MQQSRGIFDYDDQPIVALASALGRSAIAIIRMSGAGTLGLLEHHFSGRLQESGKMSFGRLCKQDIVLDEVMIAPFLSGSGYTGEEAAELFCHGNPYIIQQILDYLVHIGFRLAYPGEFSYRAVRNNKMDLTQAEAVHELITAQTTLAAQSALTRLSGRLGREFDAIYQQIIDQLGAVEAYLDYPEEELDAFNWHSLWPLLEQLRGYLQQEPVGQILNHGALVVIAGEPNVGKSSLFNWLVGSERAIVSAHAGTTRDYIETTLDILGYPIRLVDTAGLRDNAEELEQLGIAKSYELFEQADLILYLSTVEQPADEAFLQRYADKLLWVASKSDAENRERAGQGLAVSVKNNYGQEALVQAIAKAIDPDGIARRKEVALLGSLRQKELVQQALAALEEAEALAKRASLDLVAFALRRASGHFAQLLGADVQEDAMSAMFRQFCLGK